MYKCFECLKIFCDSNRLVLHIKFFHPATVSDERLKCCSCSTMFSSLKNFSRHLKSKHKNSYKADLPETSCRNEIFLNPVIAPQVMTSHRETSTENNENVCEEISSTSGNDSSDIVLKKSIENHHTSFITNLLSIGSLNRKNIKTIIDETNTLQHGILECLRESVIQTFNNENSVSAKLSEIKNIFDSAIMPSAFLTEHKQMKYLKLSSLYIEPNQYYFDQTLQNKRKLNNLALEPTMLVAHYIPITKTLKSIFQLPGVLELSKSYMANFRSEDEYSDFKDGSLWKNKIAQFPGKTVFPIFLYYDDIEIGNVLGSHSGIHKLGAVYFLIKCFPPKYLSKLDNIHLTLLFHSDDRSKYGNERTFKPLIDDLIILEKSGIIVNINGTNEQIFFVLVLLLGDNLGSNSWSGFVELFNANYCCRHCSVHRDELHHMTIERPQLLRTVPQYENCDIMRPDLHGVKEKCVFNRITSFHVLENAHVDIMHDLLEGAFNYDMAQILDIFINERNYFSLDMLNFRINHFNYGYLEKWNKPPLITNDNLTSGKLKMSASEMVTFVRTLRFLIGNFVPAESDGLILYLLLLQICEISFSKSIPKGCSNLLRTLIAEHHALYLELFGNLRPKYHFMIHYPQIIEKSGPLINFMSMRYESKHTELKSIANSIKCRKNITKSICIRYQLKQCKRLLSKKTFEDIIVLSKRRTLASMKDKNKYGTILSVIGYDYNYEFVKFFKCDGCTYQIGTRILVSSDGIWPTFGEIIGIILKPEIVLIIQLYSTVSQDSHFNAFVVFIANKFTSIVFNKMDSLETVSLYMSNKKKYIIYNNL